MEHPQTVRESLDRALNQAKHAKLSDDEKFERATKVVDKWASGKHDFPAIRQLMAALIADDHENMKNGGESLTKAIIDEQIDMDAAYVHAQLCNKILDEGDKFSKSRLTELSKEARGRADKEERIQKWIRSKPHYRRLQPLIKQIHELERDDIKHGKPSTSGGTNKDGLLNLDILYRHALICDEIMNEEQAAHAKGYHTPNSLVDRGGVLQVRELSQEARRRRDAEDAEKPESKGLRADLRRALAAHTSKER